jgi:hypothetical protein
MHDATSLHIVPGLHHYNTKNHQLCTVGVPTNNDNMSMLNNGKYQISLVNGAYSMSSMDLRSFFSPVPSSGLEIFLTFYPQGHNVVILLWNIWIKSVDLAQACIALSHQQP